MVLASSWRIVCVLPGRIVMLSRLKGIVVASSAHDVMVQIDISCRVESNGDFGAILSGHVMVGLPCWRGLVN